MIWVRINHQETGKRLEVVHARHKQWTGHLATHPLARHSAGSWIGCHINRTAERAEHGYIDPCQFTGRRMDRK
jgi:hypothetical protein